MMGFYRTGNSLAYRQVRANIITLSEIQLMGFVSAAPVLTITGDDGTSFRARSSGNGSYRLTGDKFLKIGVSYRIADLNVRAAVPKLLEARQTAANQIEMVYDRPCDLASAVKVTNYWIRVSQAQPTGIGTVGMNGRLLPSNSLTPQNSVIAPTDSTKMRFTILFKQNAVPGIVHEVLPCFVNQEGHTGYRGENWDQDSRNQFTAR
ncbi:hypothetical protein [Metabacillus sp. FJAT-52054]|uniref:Uncharacterized protein n=1 Tax=Metabacillus sediminis TaxID=3117746 RepID=A0ABZ2NHV8_9BACI